MLEILQKALAWLPVLVAANVLLSAVSGVFGAAAKALGKPDAGPVAAMLSKISDLVKKVVDFVSANVAHK